ncbi:hypothetical protein EOM09_07915 [bacterium]|nr:FKBP-type peptidyl-prolyl cis-trans isomerase [Candidatus ainarchaeum sp.]MDD3975981.1 FKBP-type peptidyl-prolyl cis-trans isomerase [Candidatus ainarchaeum sp.]NCC71474.1 hypothetical protein [bacterium]
MIQNKNIIQIDLILKDNDSKEILDTTFENVAKESGLNIKSGFKPLNFIFGTGELLKGVEENIKDLEEGKSKTFILKQDQAFGKKDPSKIELHSLNDFKKENIKPEPGMVLNFGNKAGKIISVSGGRVKIDFNSLFAGRDLEYTITLNKIISEDKDKIPALLEKAFSFIPRNQLKYVVDDSKKIVDVHIPLGMPVELDYYKQLFSKMVLDTTTYDSIKFSQNFYRDEQK